MPRIRLSTETVRPVSQPNLRLSHDWISGVRAIREGAYHQERADMEVIRAIDTAIAGAGRIKDIVVRRAERDADEAATAWEAAMLAGMGGTVGKDGKRTGGIEQKTWADYEASGSSPIKDIGKIEKSFQSSDVYKNLSGMAREKFNRRVAVRRAQYLGEANRIYDRNAQARTAFYDREADAIVERKMADAMMLDDASFEKVEEEEVFRRTARAYRPYMENPDVVDAPGANPDHIRWKDEKMGFYFNKAFLDGRRKESLGRCVALAESAAMCEPKWVDGKLVTNDEQLKKAEEYARSLASPKTLTDGTKLPARITEDEAKLIAYKCQQARSQLDERVKKAIATETANAQAKGDLATLEATERKMSAAASGFDHGSERQTAALVAAKSLSKQADERATFDIMNDLAEGKRLTLPDGKTSIFDPKTQARYARLFPSVKAAWDAKQYRQNRDVNILEARAKMLEFAGTSPQGYYNYLAQKVVDRKLSPGDFTRLRDEYNSGWMRGYKGQNGQTPRQMQLAGKLLDIIKYETGTDLWTAVERNDDGTAKLDKSGLLKLDEKGERPDVEYDRNRDWWFDKGEKFSTKEMIDIVNMSLSLAMCDGMEIDFDPTDPERGRLDKPRRVNAVEDFRTFIRGLKDSKRVLSAADEMRKRAVYAANVRMAAATAERQRTAEMLNSRPVAEEKKQEKSEEQ